MTLGRVGKLSSGMLGDLFPPPHHLVTAMEVPGQLGASGGCEVTLFRSKFPNSHSFFLQWCLSSSRCHRRGFAI